MFFKFKKPSKDLSSIADQLLKSLSVLRLTFCTTLPISLKLKQEGQFQNLEINTNSNFHDNIELTSILLGFQLTCTIGFIFKQGYHKNVGEVMNFENRIIVDSFANNNAAINRCKLYKEKYLDCQGNIDCIESIVTEDILKSLNLANKPDYINNIKGMIHPFGIWSQAALAECFGDLKTSIKLKKLTIN